MTAGSLRQCWIAHCADCYTSQTIYHLIASNKAEATGELNGLGWTRRGAMPGRIHSGQWICPACTTKPHNL